MNLIDLDHKSVDMMVNAKSIDDAWNIVCDKKAEVGFNYVLYGANRLRRIGDFGNAADSYFLSDLPGNLMRELVDKELYRHLPVAVWAMQNKGVVSLKYGADLFHSNVLTPEMAASQKFFMDAGVTGGYVVSFNEPGSVEAAALCFMSTQKKQEEVDAIWQENGAVLQTYASLFNLRASTLPIPIRGKGLKPRQKEILQWIAQGKTSSEIAIILDLSVATIEKHLRLAREVFGVNTTLQAVLYAQITAQIFTVKR